MTNCKGDLNGFFGGSSLAGGSFLYLFTRCWLKQWRRRRGDLQARVRARPRGRRVQAAGLAVPRRPLAPLAQDQEPGSAGSDRAACPQNRVF
jgi:hypothetical protein